MKIGTKFALSTLSVAVLATSMGCGGGSRSHSTQETLEGAVIDDKMAGALVCVDRDRDGNCGSDEESTTSDSNGDFEFRTRYPGSVLLSLAYPSTTTYVGTGLAIDEPIVMLAPPRSATVTPLTTLVQVAIEQEDVTLAAAQTTVANALGLSASLDFTDFDYEELETDDAQKASIAAELVVRVIEQTYSVMEVIDDGDGDLPESSDGSLDRDVFDAAVLAVLDTGDSGTESSLTDISDIVDDAITIAEANGGDASDVEFDSDGELQIEVGGTTIVEDGVLDGAADDGGVAEIPEVDDIDIVSEEDAEDILQEVEDNNSDSGDGDSGGSGSSGASGAF